VFFKDIFMLILESPTSSFQHKWMILQACLACPALAWSLATAVPGGA
jgi:hypothetical protein